MSDATEPAPPTPPSGGPRRTLRQRLRRGAPLLLLAAGALVWRGLGPKLPRDHEVSLRFGDASRAIERVEVEWAATGGDAEPAVATRWAFTAGSAPRSLSTRVRLPDGEWTLALAIDRAPPHAPLRLERKVALGAGTLVVPLEAALAGPETR